MDHEGLLTDDPLRALPRDELDQFLEDVVDSWLTAGLSEHLSLEVAAAFARTRPLDPGVSVPGCACERCTGISAEAPAWTRRTPLYARKMQGRASWEARVDLARAVTVFEVVQRRRVDIAHHDCAIYRHDAYHDDDVYHDDHVDHDDDTNEDGWDTRSLTHSQDHGSIHPPQCLESA